MAFTAPIGCATDVLSLNEKPVNPTKPAGNTTPVVLVYPNPVKTSFTVKLDNFNTKDLALLLLFDTQGREVLRKDIKTARSIIINTSEGLKQGIYFLRVIAGEKDYMQKVVVTD
jgi:hypothetical protein